MSNTDLAKRFFEAIEANDIEALSAVCTSDFISHQNGGPGVPLEGLFGFIDAVHKVTENFRYENPVRSETATGFVEEHDVCGKLADGTNYLIRVCLVGEVENGKISELREYVDTKKAAPLSKALSQG